MAARKPQDQPPFAPEPSPKDILFEKALPANADAERYVLGSVLLNVELFQQVAESLNPEDFSSEKHRRIFGRMKDLADRGERIDRVTLVDELMRQGQLESVDGIAYIASLDDGLPEITNLKSYIGIVLEKADLRRVIFTAQRAINMALLGSQTAQEIGAGATQLLGELRSGRAVEENPGKTPDQIITSFPGGIGAFLDPTLREKGLSTPFHKLNEVLGGGFREGELIVLAARPGMGKSACMLNIAEHLTMHPRNPVPAAMFSLEMTSASLLTRLMCGRARVDAHKFRAGFLNSEERRRLQVTIDLLSSAPLRIFDRFGITMDELSRHIKRCIKEDGCKIVFIDYLGLIATKGRAENRNIEISNMTRQFKSMTEEFRIPIVLLSQLNRANEKRTGDKKPILSDLRDSGSVEQDADTVLFIHRDEVYNRDREDIKGLADLIVAKQRNGPITTVPLRFLGQFTKFENRAEDLEDISYEADDAPEVERENW